MINQLSEVYEFGRYRVDPSERLLTRDGDAVRLAPKVFDTLMVLVENRGRLASKGELMTRIWPGTFIQEATLAGNISDLRKALAHGSNDQKFVETVPKHGYRFIAPVRELNPRAEDLLVELRRSCTTSEETEDIEQVEEAAGAQPERVPDNIRSILLIKTGRKKSLARSYLIVVLGAVVMIAASGFYVWKAGTRNDAPAREVPSIGVLPFFPISPEMSDECLELGMADALITSLSSINRIVVRPTSSVRKYAGLETDPVAAGRELRVDSVLQGNVQHSGDRIRVRARLVRVNDGRALWTGEFDEKSADLFTVQDRISQQMTEALALKLSGGEKRLLVKRYTDNAVANELYRKGRFFWNKRTVDGLNKGAEYFEQAIALDPRYALAVESPCCPRLLR